MVSLFPHVPSLYKTQSPQSNWVIFKKCKSNYTTPWLKHSSVSYYTLNNIKPPTSFTWSSTSHPYLIPLPQPVTLNSTLTVILTVLQIYCKFSLRAFFPVQVSAWKPHLQIVACLIPSHHLSFKHPQFRQAFPVHGPNVTPSPQCPH